MKAPGTREGEPSWLLDGLFRRLRDLAGRGEADAATLKETLADLIGELTDSRVEAFTVEQRTLLLNALAFGELEVDDVMVPRTDIDGIPVGTALAEVVAAMRNARGTRLVVYRDTLDDVLGTVVVKDLLAFWGDGAAFELAALVRPALVVPTSMRALELLLEMRDQRMDLAIVVDEFGGTDGLVAIEDLVEALVGELQASAPTPSNHVAALPDGTIEADARIELTVLERYPGVPPFEPEEREEADTLGGLVVSLVDRVPRKGEVVIHPNGLHFEVLDGDARRVKRLRVSGLRPQSSTGQAGMDGRTS